MDVARTTTGLVGLAGGALTVLGLAGYLAGLAVPYPGRAFSVTALMLGVTLAAVASGMGGGP